MLKKWLEDAIKSGHIRSINYHDFYNINSVARGASSEVLKAYWTNGESFVALKTHNNASRTEGSLDSFVRELKFIRHLEFCDHVIRFYGISYGVDPSQQSCLDALKVIVNQKLVNINNCSNTPNNGTPIAPPLSQINANMAE
ncbi:13152_t:CDS:2 [Racocetra persica]|uniref:13152_t:CDS:1 n=1 Tax=Racocetra persica TaxID=160502 RepID=A0ACA9MHW9_9GLOM|nr:13152_t:CDS:2 [Racocetra persica]